jgi:hypothetical protein
VNIWGKLKPNVLIVTLIVGALIFVFGLWLVPELAKQVSNEILALLIGVGIGGLLGIAGALASDGPPDHLGKALEIMKQQRDDEREHYAEQNAMERDARIEIARIEAGRIGKSE